MIVEFNDVESFLAEIDESVDCIRSSVHSEPCGEGAARLILIAGYILRGVVHELRYDCGIAYEGPTEQEPQQHLQQVLERIGNAAQTHEAPLKGGRFVVS